MNTQNVVPAFIVRAGDPVLEVTDQDVALTDSYQGRRRMTLTCPLLNRSRHILWVATGTEKAQVPARLLSGDVSIPVGRVRQDQTPVQAHIAAAGKAN
jgi:6-phosphogluconolactonase